MTALRVKFLYKKPFLEYLFPSKIKKSPSEVTSPPKIIIKILLDNHGITGRENNLPIALIASGSKGFAGGRRFFFLFSASLS